MTNKRKRRYVTYKDWITQEGLIKIKGWARDGLINEEIADKIGIAEGTLYNWKNKYNEIDEALKEGKEVIDRKVEQALYKRALGYSYVETTKEPIVNPANGQIHLGVTKEVTKEVAGDITAQIFWLKNRKPTEWRDKQNIEHSGELTQTIKQEPNLSNLSVEELKELETIISKSITDTSTD